MEEASLGEVELNWSLLSAEALESELEARAEERRGAREVLLRLLLPQDRLTSPPRTLGSGFPHPHLHLLDVSGNALKTLGPELLMLSGLRMLLARTNRLCGQGLLPKDLAQQPLCRSLQVLLWLLRGNCFRELPALLLVLLELRELRELQTLSLGGNQLQNILAENLQSLEYLYLGGDFIKEIPPELANLPSLNYFVLCDKI